LRKYFPQTEHILFAESKKKVPFAFEVVRSHIEGARKAAGISRKQINQACGCQMSGHWFDKSQFTIPSEKHYTTLNKLFSGVLKPYPKFKAEYKAIKEKRRYFSVSKQVPYTNVWDFKPVAWYQGKHPCEKPQDLMQHIIQSSSREGETVLDTFVGSGSTAIASKTLNRKFIGCEMGEEEFKGAVGRV